MSQDHTQFVPEIREEIEHGGPLYALERPVWGYRSMSVQALRRHAEDLLGQGAASRDDGGFLAVPYAHGQEQDVITNLLLLLGSLRQRGEPVRLLYPLTHPLVLSSDLPAGYLLVHQAPRIVGLPEAFEQGPGWWRGRVVIATGLTDDWARLSLSLPVRFHRLPQTAGESHVQIVVKECEELARQEQIREAYSLVASFDAFEVPLPLSLLARALGQDEDQAGAMVEGARNLLYWVERERPAGLLVSTKGPDVARGTLDSLYGEGADGVLQASHRRVLASVEPEDQDERHAILRLCPALVRSGRRLWARRLVDEASLDAVWQRGTWQETLGWAWVFADLNLYELADRAFRWALDRDGDNREVSLAYARFLGRWAQANPAKYARALDVFARAAALAADNPHLWQAWGRMEIALGQLSKAQGCLDRVLGMSPTNLFTVIPAADLAVALERYDAAIELLAQAGAMRSEAPATLCLSGKAATGQGQLEQAAGFYQNALDLHPANVTALTALASLEAQRGNRESSEERLRQALQYDPGNPEVLMAAAKIRGGVWHDYHGALRHLRTALRVDPGNRHVQSAWVALLERVGRVVWAWVEGIGFPASAAPPAYAGVRAAAPLAETRGNWVRYEDKDTAIVLAESAEGGVIATVEVGGRPVEGAVVCVEEVEASGRIAERATGITDEDGEVILVPATALGALFSDKVQGRYRVRVVLAGQEGDQTWSS